MKEPIEKMYASKKSYVEDTLRAMIEPLANLSTIAYARDFKTGTEIIKIVESNGYPWFINVTGNSEAAIGEEVCRLVTGIKPNGLVKNRAAQVGYNRMFDA